MFHSQYVVKHRYEESLDNVGIQLFNTQGNLWGFLAENNDSSNTVFLQFFDSASGASGSPVFTIRVPAGSAMGKDVDELASYHFIEGCFVRVCDTRTGATLTANETTVQFWYANH
jgi:hypothetical protein